MMEMGIRSKQGDSSKEKKKNDGDRHFGSDQSRETAVKEKVDDGDGHFGSDQSRETAVRKKVQRMGV